MDAAAGGALGAGAADGDGGTLLPAAAATGLVAPRVWPVLTAMIAAYAVQYITYFRLQKVGGPLMLSLIGPVAGVVGPLGAVALLGEPLPEVFPLAAALTGCGVWLMLRGR